MPPASLQYETLALAAQRARLPSQPERARWTHTYGVLSKCTDAEATRGTDQVVKLTLHDDSVAQHEELVEGVDMIVFCREGALLPRPRAKGDILLAYRVICGQFGGRPQLLGKQPGAQPQAGKPFAFALFDGAMGGSNEPYQTGGALDVAPDPAVLLALRQLALRERYTTRQEQEVPRSCLRHLGQVVATTEQQERAPCTDIRCQVVAVDARPSDAGTPLVLWVWDGHDVAPVPRGYSRLPAKPSEQQELLAPQVLRDLPTEAQEGVALLAGGLPPLGSVVPAVFTAGARLPDPLPQPGAWVKVKFVGPQFVEGQLQLVFGGPPSKLMPSEPEKSNGRWPSFAERWQERLDLRLTAEHAPPAGSWMLRSEEPGLPLVSVRQVVAQQGSGVSAKFRLLARLVMHWPGRVQDLSRRVPAAAGAKRGRDPDWSWACKLLLRDATGELEVLVSGLQGDKVFGFPACDLADPANAARLAELEALVAGMTGALPPQGWLEVTFSSVYHRAPGAAAAQKGAGAGHQSSRADGGAGGEGSGHQAAAAQAESAPAAPRLYAYLVHSTVLQQPEAAGAGDTGVAPGQAAGEDGAGASGGGQQQQQEPVPQGEPGAEEAGPGADAVPAAAAAQPAATASAHTEPPPPGGWDG